MTLALLVAIVGVIVYIIFANLKEPGRMSACIAEVGRISFFAGLFVWLLQTGPALLSHLLHG